MNDMMGPAVLVTVGTMWLLNNIFHERSMTFVAVLLIVIGGVGASVAGEPGRYLGLLGLYDVLFAIICWASFEYVVTE